MKTCSNGFWKIEIKKAPVRALFSLLRQSGEHIFDKDAVAAGGIAHQNVGDRADELSVLDDGGATRPLPVAEEGRGASGSGR